jgi:hypothetical protein
MSRSIELVQEPDDPAVIAIGHWASSYPIEKQPAEAELWALGWVQLLGKFPTTLGSLSWRQHPYTRLVQIHATQGNIREMIKWEKKWLQDHPFVPGSLSFDQNAEAYTLTGSGRGIGLTWDEFHFGYKVLQGDGMIVAKVEIPEHADNSAYAGVMIRNSLEPDACHVSLTISDWVFLKRREAESQRAATNFLISKEDAAPPQWVRLERRGNAFTAHHSPDGEHWELIRPDAASESSFADIEMDEQVYIGLAVTSGQGPHVAGQADFSQVSVTGDLDSDGPFAVSRDIGLPPEASSGD